MRKFLVILSLLVLLAVPTFAQDGDATIAEIVIASTEADTPEFTTLLTAVTAADPSVVEALSNPDAELTVFAPTDEAFAALVEAFGEDAFNDIVADTTALTNILLYHVVEGAVFAETVVTLDGEMVPTLLEDFSVTISVEDGNVFVNESQVITTDIEASNGVIHVIDAVLVPSADEEMEEEMMEEMGTIVDVAVGNEDFATLVAAVTAADLVETLSSEGPFTVFAPTNDAFAALLEELGVSLEDVVGDMDLLTSVLLYHVVAGEVFSTDISDGMEVETVGGGMFTVNVSDDGVSITDANGRMSNIVAVDVEASNGVIHVLDTVILPSMGGEEEAMDDDMSMGQSIVDIVIAGSEGGVNDREGFSFLLNAVLAADPAVVETLSGEGPFTVFAPNNQAFYNLSAVLADLGLTINDVPQEVLTQVLLYHVVEGDVRAEAVLGLPANANVPTLLNDEQNGIVVAFTSSGAPILNGGIDIIATDIEASNGVIHVINDVLLPQCVLDTLAGTGSCG